MTTTAELVAQLLGSSALPTVSSGQGAHGAYGASISGEQARNLARELGFTDLLGRQITPENGYVNGQMPVLGGHLINPSGGYAAVPGTSGGVLFDFDPNVEGGYLLAYTPNRAGSNMALEQSNAAGNAQADMMGKLIVGGILGAGLGATDWSSLGGAQQGGMTAAEQGSLFNGLGDTTADIASSGAGATWDAGASLAENLGLPQASFAAPSGATPIYSTLPGGVEGVTAYQLANGAVVPVSDLALGSGVGAGLIGGVAGGAATGILSRLGNSVSNLFGNGSGGTGLSMKDLFTLAKTGTGIYSLLNANKQAGKTNAWQQGQVPQGTNFDLSPTMPGGALGRIAGMTPQNWQSKIGYAEGGEVVRPGMDKPSIVGFLQYLYNSKKLPSELAQERQKKRSSDELQRGITEVTSPNNALDRRMKELNLKGGGPLSLVRGPGAGQDDAIPARLSDGEYVFDADTVSALGDGSTDAGAAKLDAMRERIRTHKRKAPPKKIPPKAKDPMAYLGGK